jgi:uncharacterized protein with von Willebrand factor type A (vWA) domain
MNMSWLSWGYPDFAKLQLYFSPYLTETALSGRETKRLRPDPRHRLNGTRQRRYAAIPNVKRLDGQASIRASYWHLQKILNLLLSKDIRPDQAGKTGHVCLYRGEETTV